MRRCKYFNSITWIYKSYPEGTMEFGHSISCNKCMLVRTWGGREIYRCNEGVYACYEPVEIDPYWKDIIDETNRRLNNA